MTEIAPMDMEIGVGFGFAGLRKDGIVVFDGDDMAEQTMGEYPTVQDAEDIASKDSDHDWRIVIHGALGGAVYQRQGPDRWVCIETNEGFA